MQVQIFHWYCGKVQEQVPEAKMRSFTYMVDKGRKITEDLLSVEIEDIGEFLLENKLGAVILYAPTEKFPYYRIAINEKNRLGFGQK